MLLLVHDCDVEIQHLFTVPSATTLSREYFVIHISVAGRFSNYSKQGRDLAEVSRCQFWGVERAMRIVDTDYWR